jgi:hypothetical protein
MLKNKNILILAAVLVVLLAVSWFQKISHQKSTSGSATAMVIEGVITADQLDRITLGQGDNPTAVELLATPTGWVVASAWDAAASTSRIDALLRNLSDLKGEFRSDKASVLADYGLDEDQAVKIVAYGKDGGEVAAVEVGNKPERVPGNFIKKPGSSAVYLSQTSLLSQLGLYEGPGVPGFSHFLELQAVKEDRLEVDRIVLQDEGRTLEMVKEFAEPQPVPGQMDDAPAADEAAEEAAAEPAGPDRTTWEWKLTSPRTKALAKTKADGVLGALVTIRALDVDDPDGDPALYGLDDPARTATLVLSDGQEMTVAFGHKREAVGDLKEGIWMKVSGEPTVWVVSEYTVKNIFKTEADLLPDQE